MSSDVTEISLPSPLVNSDSTDPTDGVLIANSISKTARDQFYANIKTINTNKSWEATCKICKTTIRGTKGVTSNYNRHIKEFHKSQYELWQEKLQFDNLAGQKKITDTVSVQKEKSTSKPGSLYSSGHPRQIELEKSIIEDLVIEIGLPLSLVERSGFIKFMAHVDPRFRVTSRRTLTRTTLLS